MHDWRVEDRANLGHGVLVRYTLHDGAPPSTSRAPAAMMPLGSLIEVVVDVLRGALGESPIDADTPLMDGGVDSYELPQIAQQLTHATGVCVCVTDFFGYPTARLIARHLQRQQQPDTIEIEHQSQLVQIEEVHAHHT